MAKFVYIYYDMGADNGDTDAWMGWFKELGDNVVDMGNPFGKGVVASAEGTMDPRDPVATGYSIVNAKDLDEAVSWTKTCPLVKSKGAVAVYEAMPM